MAHVTGRRRQPRSSRCPAAARHDGWLGSPRAVVRASALQHNIATMARYCRDHGVDLYPHGKTTMAPQVVAAQLDAGAAGVTVATVAQLRVFQAHGLGPGLVANQVVDEAGATWLGRTLADDEHLAASCYVDSVEGVARLDRLVAAARGAGTRRAGCPGRARPRRRAHRRPHPAAGRSRWPRRWRRASALELVGVAGYEGSHRPADAFSDGPGGARVLPRLGDLARRLLDRGLLPERPVVSAGGSAYFDAVVDALAGEDAWRLVLRSGCYVTHDHGLYHDISPFERADEGYTLRPALQVFAPVLSRPERGTVVDRRGPTGRLVRRRAAGGALRSARRPSARRQWCPDPAAVRPAPRGRAPRMAASSSPGTRSSSASRTPAPPSTSGAGSRSWTTTTGSSTCCARSSETAPCAVSGSPGAPAAAARRVPRC